MTNYLIMQARIADELVRDDLAGQIQKAINSAIQTWEGFRFAFNERKYLIQTVADQEYYDLVTPTLLTYPAGAAVGTGETILELDHDPRITVNSSYYRLTPRSQSWFEDNTGPASQYTGQPDSYGIFDNQLRLFPIPDGVYPLKLEGLARLSPNPLSADADTNAWMVEGEALIRQHAKLIIYRDVVRDAEGRANAADGVQEAQFQLERKSIARTMVGTQRAWSL